MSEHTTGPGSTVPTSTQGSTSSVDPLRSTAPADGRTADEPAVQRVIDALATAGVNASATVLPDSTRTAAHAAAALGCDIGAIANSLVFMADEQPLLVLTSGAHRVDVERLAQTLGAGLIRKATADEVKSATGQSIGGVSPVGHPAPITTLLDAALAAYPVIWAAAGTSHAVFSSTFDDLARATAARVVDVS